MTAPDTRIPEPDRRDSSERRLLLDRRSGVDRRQLSNSVPGSGERRQRDDRRLVGERRAFLERRLALQSAGDQIRGALKLMPTPVESGAIPEQHRRALDAAMLRLRFALEHLEVD